MTTHIPIDDSDLKFKDIAQMSPAVSVVMVHFRHPAQTWQALEALFASTLMSIEVILVDNGKDGGEPYAFGHPQLLRLANERNEGFAKACNQGARKARGEFLFFLNSDAHVHPGCIEALMAYLRYHPDVMLAGPQLLYPNGRVQGQGSLLGAGRWGGSHPRHKAFISGAAMLIRAKDFGDLGAFDEQFVFYNEDVDLCRRIRRQKKHMAYVPTAKVTHLGGGSGTQTPFTIEHGHQGALRLAQKHYPRWVAGSYRGLMLAETAVLGCWSAVRQKPAQAQAYRKVLGWLWRAGRVACTVLLLMALSTPLWAAEYDAERVKQTIHWQAQVQKNPEDSRSHFELAMIYALTGRVEKGLAELGKLQPSYAPDIIKVYEPLVQSEPWDADHRFKLAFAYYFANRKEDAKKMFQRILDENNPDHVWALGYKALIIGYEGDNDTVIKLCQRALEIDKNAAGILYLRGEAYRKKGDLFKGATDILKALRLRALDEHDWKKWEREAR